MKDNCLESIESVGFSPSTVQHQSVWIYVHHFVGYSDSVEFGGLFVDYVQVGYPDFVHQFGVKLDVFYPQGFVEAEARIIPPLSQVKRHVVVLESYR